MANLSSDQIKERIKKPVLSREIEQAIKHESKLKLHCQTIVDKSEFGEPVRAFLDWVKGILPEDKHQTFESLLQPPFPTLELTESIFTELSRIFEGQNRFLKFEFKNPDFVEDLSDYRIELDDDSFWKNTAWEVLQYSINSFIVVDLPREQATPLPAPYYYVLDISSVYDVQYTRKGDVDFIIIDQGKQKYLYIDSLYYIYVDMNTETVFEATPHNIGYTPVKDFWKTRRNKDNKVDKKGPITKSLSSLNWLLFFEISKMYLDLYAAYPIYSAYESKCDYRDENGNYCEGGQILVNEGYRSCPSCCDEKGKKKRKIGVGSIISIPIPSASPTDSNQMADLRNPVQVLPAEITSLEYCRSEIQRLEKEIFENCLGKGGESNTDQAQNEKQVKGGFESKINVLTRVKNNYEYIHKWTIDTIAKLRYGDSFINSTISYGDITYLESIQDLNDDYSEAKKNGKPVFELLNKRDRIYNTENKNNSDEQTRKKILSALEPWQSYSIEQIKANGLDILSPNKFLLKINFDEYIQRFEREQANILMFAENLAFAARINRIKDVLMEYVAEETSAQAPPINVNPFNKVA